GCHNIDNMLKKEQSNHAVKAHQRAKRNNTTCINCHWGTAHKIPKVPLPEAARPSVPGQPVQCTGCHTNFKLALSDNHPDIAEPSLKVCLRCHASEKTVQDTQNAFYTFLHKSHANRIECTGCHKTTEEGDFSILSYED
ncbi:MAG: hypothetical protein GXP19_07880, partial [Gammaproteobacteria bacterium]|nr:hypothetical protein [Gammaproteobacteria bacterium]